MGIEVEVRKKLGEFQLNVQFQSDSKRIGILGASGCGKSMTLRSIAGIEKPDEGRIAVDGKVLFDSEQKINEKPQKRKVGYLFQNYALFPTMTIEENIAAGLTGSRGEKEVRVREMMQSFELEALAGRLPGELSGGQQQRVALARIMAYQPGVILLDEPYTALDMFLKDKLQQELIELLQDYEGTVIMVSHNRDEIYRFAEELLILEAGRSVACGGVKELFANPRQKDAARLTGCKNIGEVHRIDAHHLEVPGWGITLHTRREIPEETTHLGFRAHEFRPIWGEREANCLAVQVQSMAELPFEKQFYLKPEQQKEACDREDIRYVKEKSHKEVLCWFVQREMWPELLKRGMPDYLQFPENKLLFLET